MHVHGGWGGWVVGADKDAHVTFWQVTTEFAADLVLQLGSRVLIGADDPTAARHAALAMAGMSARAHLHWQQFAPAVRRDGYPRGPLKGGRVQLV